MSVPVSIQMDEKQSAGRFFFSVRCPSNTLLRLLIHPHKQKITLMDKRQMLMSLCA